MSEEVVIENDRLSQQQRFILVVRGKGNPTPSMHLGH